MVRVRYDGSRATTESLAKQITDLGFKIEIVGDELRSATTGPDTKQKAPVPRAAPKFFRDAFATARAERQPVVIDFWASWCPPCIRLKKETLSDERIRKMLRGAQLVYVDLDEYPALGEAYGVESVPDVFLIDRDGYIADRLHDFEPPNSFAKRLQRLLDGITDRTEQRNFLRGSPVKSGDQRD